MSESLRSAEDDDDDDESERWLHLSSPPRALLQTSQSHSSAMLRTATQSLRTLRTAAPRPLAAALPLRQTFLAAPRHYSAAPAADATQEPAAAAGTDSATAADPNAVHGNDAALADLNKQLEDHKKAVAEHKVRPRSSALPCPPTCS